MLKLDKASAMNERFNSSKHYHRQRPPHNETHTIFKQKQGPNQIRDDCKNYDGLNQHRNSRSSVYLFYTKRASVILFQLAPRAIRTRLIYLFLAVCQPYVLWLGRRTKHLTTTTSNVQLNAIGDKFLVFSFSATVSSQNTNATAPVLM